MEWHYAGHLPSKIDAAKAAYGHGLISQAELQVHHE